MLFVLFVYNLADDVHTSTHQGLIKVKKETEAAVCVYFVPFYKRSSRLVVPSTQVHSLP